MGVIIFLIIVGVVIWLVHSKLEIGWGSIGLGIAGLLAWVMKSSHDDDVKSRERAKAVTNASREQLLEWVTQDEDLGLKSMAGMQLRERYGDNWRRLL